MTSFGQRRGMLLTLGICSFVLVLGGAQAQGWDNAEMEMYDLIEELGQNFYDVLGLPHDTTSKEIKQAYRRLSIKLHPDKNPDPDAATKFRQLVGVYEVLKDTEMREAYDKVLVEGMPTWRQPMFYYRRYRKLALWQVSIIVLVVVSVGQYLAGWAGYWEQRLSVKEKVEAQRRRTQRTRKAQKEGPTQDELEAEIMEQYFKKPSVWNLLPFQLMRGGKYLVVGFPFDVYRLVKQWQHEKEEQEKQKIQEEEEAELERQIAEEPKKPRKRKTFKVPEKTKEELEAAKASWCADKVEDAPERAAPVVSGGLWTDEDISELVKLCSKYPGGTPARWETIASFLHRPVQEVTFMARKVLDQLAKKPAEEEEETPQLKLKVKTKSGKGDILDRLKVENWSAEEQKSLESALQVYPKGASERWDKIASKVPGRSKEECMQRFKYVADLVKKSREKKDDDEAGAAGAAAEEQSQSEPVAEEVAEPEELPDSPKLSRKARRKKQRRRSLSTDSADSDQDWLLVDEESAQ